MRICILRHYYSFSVKFRIFFNSCFVVFICINWYWWQVGLTKSSKVKKLELIKFYLIRETLSSSFILDPYLLTKITNLQNFSCVKTFKRQRVDFENVDIKKMFNVSHILEYVLPLFVTLLQNYYLKTAFVMSREYTIPIL